jgi:hypothetical protein
MAKTKQTAAKSTGGKAPREALKTKAARSGGSRPNPNRRYATAPEVAEAWKKLSDDYLVQHPIPWEAEDYEGELKLLKQFAAVNG